MLHSCSCLKEGKRQNENFHQKGLVFMLSFLITLPNTLTFNSYETKQSNNYYNECCPRTTMAFPISMFSYLALLSKALLPLGLYDAFECHQYR